MSFKPPQSTRELAETRTECPDDAPRQEWLYENNNPMVVTSKVDGSLPHVRHSADSAHRTLENVVAESRCWELDNKTMVVITIPKIGTSADCDADTGRPGVTGRSWTPGR
jgi:hypothetical protein